MPRPPCGLLPSFTRPCRREVFLPGSPKLTMSQEVLAMFVTAHVKRAKLDSLALCCF
jgi:hypothetical protein